MIRDATETDAEAVQQIYAPYVTNTAISFEMVPPTADEMLARMRLATARLPWIVLEDAGQVVGYAYATQFRAREAYQNTAETTVYVSQAHSRKGVGLRLMTELLSRLRDGGFHRVIAGVTLPNPGSVGLHERLGYWHVGVFSQVGRKFDQWHDVGFWELSFEDGSSA